jgi:hypothetical protein
MQSLHLAQFTDHLRAPDMGAVQNQVFADETPPEESDGSRDRG